jgi:hypothetical protein
MGAPGAADHIALRTLVKYLSSVEGIPYKLVGDGTHLREEHIKAYVNDKAIKGNRLTDIFVSLSQRCAEIVAQRGLAARQPDFIIGIEEHLFGESWLASVGLDRKGSGFERALARWLDTPDSEIGYFEDRYAGLWRVVRPMTSDRRSRTMKSVKEFNFSLLNIRPRKTAQGTLPNFRWYVATELHHRYSVIEGSVIPQFDSLGFLGRISARHRLLTLMSWASNFDPDLVERHAESAFGIALSSDAIGRPIMTRLQAFFVPDSARYSDRELEEMRLDEMRHIGIVSADVAKRSIPAEQWDRLIDYFENKFGAFV